jgi:putative hemolysin
MTVRNLMKEPLFVEPQMKVETLFRRFRQMKRHIAIIENKAGRALAVITMEDILEQMFGELWEEHR